MGWLSGTLKHLAHVFPTESDFIAILGADSRDNHGNYAETICRGSASAHRTSIELNNLPNPNSVLQALFGQTAGGLRLLLFHEGKIKSHDLRLSKAAIED